MEKKKLNILIAIESFFDGGAEMFAIKLANELARAHNVYFLELFPYSTTEKRQLPLLDLHRVKLLQPGKSIIADRVFKNVQNENYYLAHSTSRAAKWYGSFKKLQVKSIIRQYKVDIVNSHSWDTDVYFSLIKSELKFKMVSTFHGHYEFLADKRLNYELVTKRTLDEVDTVIYASPGHVAVMDKYLFPLPKRAKIFIAVTMPLSAQKTVYRQGDCLNLVMVARGVKEKGWQEAIVSVLTLLEKYPGLLKLSLVGEGAYLDELRLKYKHPGIIFMGYKSDVSADIRHSHIGLLPSYYLAESTPTVVIEYLSCGKPVMASNVGAIKEMISTTNGLAGCCLDLVQGTVPVKSLSDALENYLTNPNLVEEHSENALQAAEKFTMKTCVKQYLKAYGIQ